MDRPILFSGPMVRALLAGAKTQTRRLVKPAGAADIFQFRGTTAAAGADEPTGKWAWCGHPQVVNKHIACPYGKPGDRLWVRETHAIVPRTAYRCSEGVQQILRPDDDHDAAIFRSGWERSFGGIRWRPSIHMPRWASRTLLLNTGVRVERLQSITREDAIAEGIVRQPDGGWGLADTTHYHSEDPRQSYFSLFEAINGEGSVHANPLLWVVSFPQVA